MRSKQLITRGPLFLGYFFVLLTFCLHNQPVQADLKKVTSVEGITEYQMDNGMRVLLFPDSSQPKFTVNITSTSHNSVS